MKKRILAWLLVLVVLFTMTPLATAVTAEDEIEQNAELLTNGDFESVTADGKTLNYWNPWVTTADYSEYTIVTDDVYEGNYAVKMKYDSSTGKLRNAITRTESNVVVGGQSYTFTAYAKACEAVGSVSIEIKFGGYGEEAIAYNNNSTDYVVGQYQKIEKTFSVPAEVTSFSIYIRVYGGEFIFDNFSIKGPKRIIEIIQPDEVIAQDTTPPQGTEQEVQSEFIPNNSFEATSTWLGTTYLKNWTALSNANDYGEYTISTDAKDGAKAIKMAFDSTKGKIRNTIYQRVDIPLVAGESYTFTAYVKGLTSEAAASVQIEQGSFLQVVSYNNTQENYAQGEYVTLEHTFTAPEGITSFNVFIRITSGEFIWDKVSIVGARMMTAVESVPNADYISGLPNILIDSSFEEKITGRNATGGWGTTTQFVNNFGHNSATCARIVNTTENTRNYLAQRLTLHGGCVYQVSLWICMEKPSDTKYSAAKNGSMAVDYITYGLDGSVIKDQSQSLGVTGTDGKWKQCVFQITPTDGTAAAMIMPRLTGRGTAWVDDVEVSLVSNENAWAVSVETDEVFYYSDREEAGTATVAINVGAHPELVGEDITFTLLRNGATLGTNTMKCESGKNYYNSSFDLSLLSEKKAEYIMKVEIGEYTAETKLYKYDRPLYIGKDGVFRDKNGKVFKPFYAYNMLDEHLDFAAEDANFNLHMIGIPSDKDGEELVQYMRNELDELQQKGYMALVQTYGLYEGLNVPGGHPSRRERTATVVAGLKDHPALFGYMNMDEPMTQSRDLRDDLRETYIAIRNNDPYHPVCTTEQGSYDKSVKYVDVLGIDPYVGTNVPYTYVGNKVTEAVAATKGEKPVYAVLQAFEWRSYWPSRNDLRDMIYQAIMAGASGIGFYKFVDAKGELELHATDLWPVISDFGQNEWNTAYKAFVKGDYPEFSTKRETNYWMNSFVKENNKLIMYVANRTNAVQEITFTLVSDDNTMSIGAYTVESSSSTQALTSGSGTITISLPASSAEFYVITPQNSSDLPDVELPDEELTLDSVISRGKFASMLIDTLNIPAGDPSDNFADVDEGKSYASQISAGKALGILVADENDLFNPNGKQTIDDALLMCLRGLRYKKAPLVSAEDMAAFTEDDLFGLSPAPVLAASILENRQAARGENISLDSNNITLYEANKLLEKVGALLLDESTDFSNLSANGARQATRILKGGISNVNDVFVSTEGTMTIVYNAAKTPYAYSKSIGSETVSIATNTAEITIADGILSALVEPNKFFVIANASAVRRGFHLGQMIYPYPVEGSRAQMEPDAFLGIYDVSGEFKELLGTFKNGDIMPQTTKDFKFLKWDENLNPKSDILLELTILRASEDSMSNIIQGIGDGLEK